MKQINEEMRILVDAKTQETDENLKPCKQFSNSEWQTQER